jgi:hypothetical protein
MQALYNYLESWGDQGIEEFRMGVEKLPGNTFRLRLSPMGREVTPSTVLYLIVTKMGITPLDNRRMF